MNFLFVNSARTWGGNEKWSLMAATMLAQNHHVVLAYRSDELGSRFTVPKYKLPFLNEADLYSLYRLISIIRRHKIDVLIPTKRKDYVLAGIASRICGVKNVLRLGIVRDLKNEWHYNVIYNKLADGIIVNAQQIKDVLLQTSYMKPEKIKVIFNGIDTVRLERSSKNPVIEKPFPFLITALGEVSDRKGFDYLIRGFANFLSRTNAGDAGLVIIGDGEKLQEFKALATSLKIEKQVIFTGFLENPYPYLSVSDVFAMTSKNEGISNALLEGIYLGNAAISTIAGGVAEVVKDGKQGLLVNYGDVEKLGDHLSRLYKDPDFRNTLAQEGYEMVTKTFSLEKMTGEIVRFCSGIVGDSTHSR